MQCGKSWTKPNFNFKANSEKKSDYFLNHVINEKKGLKRALEEQIIENAKFSKTKPGKSEIKQQNIAPSREEDKAFHNNITKTKLFQMLTKEKNDIQYHIDNLSPGNSTQNSSTNMNKSDTLMTQEHLKDFIKLAEESVSKSISSSCGRTDINNNNVFDMATEIEELETNSKTDLNNQKGYGLRPRNSSRRKVFTDTPLRDPQPLLTLPHTLKPFDTKPTEPKPTTTDILLNSNTTRSPIPNHQITPLCVPQDLLPKVSSFTQKGVTRSPRQKTISKFKQITANARERDRMKEINVAFAALRSKLPNTLFSRSVSSMTKHNTLQLALSYIKGLSQLLEESSASDHVENDDEFNVESLSQFLEDNTSNSIDSSSSQSLSQFLERSTSNSIDAASQSFSEILKDETTNSTASTDQRIAESMNRLPQSNINLEDSNQHNSYNPNSGQKREFTLNVDLVESRIPEDVYSLVEPLHNLNEFDGSLGLDLMFETET